MPSVPARCHEIWNMIQPLQSKWPGRASAQELPPPCPRIRSEAHPPPGQAASVGFIGIGGLEMPWQTSTQHLQRNMVGQKKQSFIVSPIFFWALYCYTGLFSIALLLVAKKNLQTSLIGFPPWLQTNPGRLMPSVPFGSLAHAHGFGLAPPLPARDSRRQARPTNGEVLTNGVLPNKAASNRENWSIYIYIIWY